MQFDLESLLVPIPGESPAGVSLRYERTYDLIREARREDDPTLPQGDWARKLKTADFSAVERLCKEALTKRTKDLRIAGWLAEAWARTAGLTGAAHGIRLVSMLLDRYWETAFPLLSDDGEEARASLIEWLDEQLAFAIRRTEIGESAGKPIFFDDWDRIERGLSPLATDDDDEPLTPEALRVRCGLLAEGSWRAIRGAADQANGAIDALHEVLEAKMEQPPVLRKSRDLIAGLVRLGREIVGDQEMSQPSSGEEPVAHVEDSEVAEKARGAEVMGSPSGPIRNRAEAYLRLSEAADFLLRTEPHSPVPYLVKRAVGWGNLSLTELLVELVGSPDDLVTIQRLLGMRGRE